MSTAHTSTGSKLCSFRRTCMATCCFPAPPPRPTARYYWIDVGAIAAATCTSQLSRKQHRQYHRTCGQRGLAGPFAQDHTQPLYREGSADAGPMEATAARWWLTSALRWCVYLRGCGRIFRRSSFDAAAVSALGTSNNVLYGALDTARGMHYPILRRCIHTYGGDRLMIFLFRG